MSDNALVAIFLAITAGTVVISLALILVHVRKMHQMGFLSDAWSTSTNGVRNVGEQEEEHAETQEG